MGYIVVNVKDFIVSAIKSLKIKKRRKEKNA
jgi:hypothetical protein